MSKTVQIDSKLSASAMEFIPKSGSFSVRENNADSTDAVIIINDAMMRLLNNPEEFYQVVNSLPIKLSTSIKHQETLKGVVEEIFQQSIYQNNYQNIFAKLCSVLSDNLKININECESFRRILLNRCKDEFNKRHELIGSNEGIKELIGFTFFMAELMINLKVQGATIKVFPTSIIQLLSLLLTIPTEDTIKCVFKVLKFTGHSLEEEKDYLDKFNAIFDKIKQVIVADDTTENLRKLLLSIVALRAQKWLIETQPPNGATGGVVPDTPPDAKFQDENGDVVYEDLYGAMPEQDDAYDYESYIREGFEAEEDVVVYDDENVEYELDADYNEMDPEIQDAYEQYIAELEPSSTASNS